MGANTHLLLGAWWDLQGRCFLEDGRGSVSGKAYEGRGGRDRQDILQGKSHLCIPYLGIALSQSQFPHSCFCGNI